MSGDHEEYCLSFVQTWAEAVLRQIDRARTMRKTFEVDGRNYDRSEDWSPTELDLERNFRSLWAEEHMLVWAAHQLEQWKVRLAEVRDQDAPERDEVLRSVRNALEHLADVDFYDGYAVPGEGKTNPSLRKLPDGRLEIALGGVRVFGLIDIHELEARALTVINTITDELEQAAAEWYFEMMQED